MNQEMTIAYATDENYLRYTATSAESLMRNLNPERNVNFIILLSTDFPESSKSILNFLPETYKNCRLTFLVMDQRFSHIVWKIKHITEPALYRLILPELLPDCKKCLYLDGDTIICDDISPLYDIDISNHFVAGVSGFGFIFGKTTQRLGFPCADYYLNSGMLLMNLEEMRKQKKVEEFISLLDRDFRWIDQDIINLACYGGILNVDIKYNFMPTLVFEPLEFFQKFKWMERKVDPVVLYEQKENAIQHPVVVHYAASLKPWENPTIPLSCYWWHQMLIGKTNYLYQKYMEESFSLETLLQFSRTGDDSYKDQLNKLWSEV